MFRVINCTMHPIFSSSLWILFLAKFKSDMVVTFISVIPSSALLDMSSVCKSSCARSKGIPLNILEWAIKCRKHVSMVKSDGKLVKLFRDTESTFKCCIKTKVLGKDVNRLLSAFKASIIGISKMELWRPDMQFWVNNRISRQVHCLIDPGTYSISFSCKSKIFKPTNRPRSWCTYTIWFPAKYKLCIEERFINQPSSLVILLLLRYSFVNFVNEDIDSGISCKLLFPKLSFESACNLLKCGPIPESSQYETSRSVIEKSSKLPLRTEFKIALPEGLLMIVSLCNLGRESKSSKDDNLLKDSSRIHRDCSEFALAPIITISL